jgi:hypothetical protein
VPNHVTSVINLSGDESRIKAMLEQIKNDEVGIGSVDFNKIMPMPDNIYCGNLGAKERAIYNKNNLFGRFRKRLCLTIK